MVELKVFVDGIQRVVCGVNDNTSCQDVIIALAQATGQTGKFKLVERNQTNENGKRTLKPQEKPLHVMSKWDKGSDAYFMLVTVGNTPNTSRPPSSMGLPTERFRQPGDGSDLSEFPKQRQTSIRRSATFNGLRASGSTKVKDLKAQVHQKAEKLHNELTELIDVQKLRLNEQQKQIEGVEAEIRGLSHLENVKTTPDVPDKNTEDMEKALQANKLAIEEVEMWQSELDIEQQLQSELLREITALKEQIADCEAKIHLRQTEAGHILDQMEKEEGRQRRVVEEQLHRHLDDVHGEVKLLEEEYRGYSANLEETNKLLDELNQVLEGKRINERELVEELDLDEDSSVVVSSKEKRVPLAVIDIDGELSPELRVPSPTMASDLQTTQQPEDPRHRDNVLAVHPQRRFRSNPRELLEAEPSSENPDGVYV